MGNRLKHFPIALQKNGAIGGHVLTGFVTLPIVLVIAGRILFHIGELLAIIPIIGFIGSGIRFVGDLWLMFAMMTNMMAGWLWLVALFYWIIISVLTAPYFNTYFETDEESAFSFKFMRDICPQFRSFFAIALIMSLIFSCLVSNRLLPIFHSFTDSYSNEVTIYNPFNILLSYAGWSL